MESKKVQTLSEPKLIQNLYFGDNVEGEAFVPDHIFSYIVSGRHDVWIGSKKYAFAAGDCRFFRRNQLAKSIKHTESDGFKSIAVHFDQNTLMEISKETGFKSERFHGEGVKAIKANGMLKKSLATFHGYAQRRDTDAEILRIKIKELVLILAAIDPEIKQMLFEFSDPGKLDLEGFMNGHYRYNVPLEKFAFLTGRSLSGFKRDFARLFRITPSRWLTKKRLNEAKYLIEDCRRRPSEIYLEIGFANMSHFSYAYKKEFGISPLQKNKNS
ncbi:AraC family transcriptional regulator [Flavobacterium sp. SH_e]|uniref:helix-turn-helix domain-containing protein n=1 Tax=Flavobacterium TaxID=237 RepID=UPI0021E3DA34|nr:AraC family transcriptional regulator [Flavobacterium sp. SH_e]MCV2484792.1 AraC family transcriptional regulator [Flavobacterium sp. SH_e]